MPPPLGVPKDGFVLGRRPGLDGLRCVAIVAVLLEHGRVLPFEGGGKVGVTLFFVLSGFLITRLLVEEVDRTRGITFGAFYARRALRLFPALTVLLVISVGGSLLRGSGLGGAQYALFYVADIAKAAGEDMPYLAHTWSLSLEEQFYLLWPVTLGLGLVVLRSRRMLISLLIVGILISTALRIVLYNGPTDADRVYYAPDTRADALLIGCLLALTIAKLGRVRLLGPIALVSACSLVLLATVSRHAFFFHVGLSLIALASAVLVAYSLYPRGIGRRLLTARPVLYVGGLSYGIYLYHFVIFRNGQPLLPGPHVLTFLACAVASVAAAALSFRLVEAPFLALQARYRPGTQPKTTPQAAPVFPLPHQTSNQDKATASPAIITNCTVD